MSNIKNIQRVCKDLEKWKLYEYTQNYNFVNCSVWQKHPEQLNREQ